MFGRGWYLVGTSDWLGKLINTRKMLLLASCTETLSRVPPHLENSRERLNSKSTDNN